MICDKEEKRMAHFLQQDSRLRGTKKPTTWLCCCIKKIFHARLINMKRRGGV